MVTNTNVSSGDVKSVLASMSYPADKQTLIKRAKKRGSDDIVSAFNGLADRPYTDESDVLMALDLESDGMA